MRFGLIQKFNLDSKGVAMKKNFYFLLVVTLFLCFVTLPIYFSLAADGSLPRGLHDDGRHAQANGRRGR